MDLCVATEKRYFMHQGRPVTRYAAYEDYWKDYGFLDVFDRVHLAARCSERDDPEGRPAEGPDLKLIRLPSYLGPFDYLRQRRAILDVIRRECPVQAAYILRVPGVIGTLVWRELKHRGQPYALEVVGDPYDVFAPGGVKHLLRPIFRRWLARDLRAQCRGAIAAAYVTKGALQQRYPCPGPTWAISNMSLAERYIKQAPRPAPEKRTFTLVQVGHLSYLYKAPHIVIDAVAKCVHEGLDLRMVFVGEGQKMPWLKQRAARRGIADRVEFRGGVPAGQPVFDVLDGADLFVLPSFQEGLPRAMVEAMARALPCIGSTAGGIPELLPAEDLVRPGDANQLAAKIKEIVTHPQRMARMSERNLKTAADYASGVLRKRRVEFSRFVEQETARWLRVRGIPIQTGTRGGPVPTDAPATETPRTEASIAGANV